MWSEWTGEWSVFHIHPHLQPENTCELIAHQLNISLKTYGSMITFVEGRNATCLLLRPQTYERHRLNQAPQRKAPTWTCWQPGLNKKKLTQRARWRHLRQLVIRRITLQRNHLASLALLRVS